MVNVVFLNNQFVTISEAKISVLDRGFLFGDGVYEVIPVYHGKPFRVHQHFERLQQSLSAIKLHFPWDLETFHGILKQLISFNDGDFLSVYLQVTRGADHKRDHAFPNPPITPTVFAMTQPLPNNFSLSPEQRAIRVITADDTRWAHCYIKATTLLPNVLLRQTATEEGMQEVILIRQGMAIEGSASNLFGVHKHTLLTPPRSQAILGGITRDLILELATHHGIPYREEDIPLSHLYTLDEVWLTNSTKEIQPVIAIDGHTIGAGKPGPLWHKMNTLFENYKNQL